MPKNASQQPDPGSSSVPQRGRTWSTTPPGSSPQSRPMTVCGRGAGASSGSAAGTREPSQFATRKGPPDAECLSTVGLGVPPAAKRDRFLAAGRACCAVHRRCCAGREPVRNGPWPLAETVGPKVEILAYDHGDVSPWSEFFSFDSPKHAKIVQLRTEYQLDELTKHAKTDMQRAAVLMKWVSGALKFGTPAPDVFSDRRCRPVGSGQARPGRLVRFWRAVRRKPTGVCSLRALHPPSPVFTEGDLANSSRQRACMRKTSGLTPVARRSV